MQRQHLLLAVSAVTCTAMILLACGPYGLDKEQLTKMAISNDPSEAHRGTILLRAMGQSGLNDLIAAYADVSHNDARWPRIASAIDAVAMQKDAWASHLYWYTDLVMAKQEARRSGTPILSLRLLGTLDSELSCANSRFFRTALYANAEVSKYLSEHFVLH